MFQPVHLFQLADDVAVVTSGEKENQLLLNCFARWCQWAQMTIRVDKCSIFGIKMFSTRSMQFQPKLLVYHESFPSLAKDESFKYPGRHFNFELEDHKAELLSLATSFIKEIDSLPIHPRNKLSLYNNSFHFILLWPTFLKHG